MVDDHGLEELQKLLPMNNLHLNYNLFNPIPIITPFDRCHMSDYFIISLLLENHKGVKWLSVMDIFKHDDHNSNDFS